MSKPYLIFKSIVLSLFITGCGSSSSSISESAELRFRGVDASFATQLSDCNSNVLNEPGAYPWQTYTDAGVNLVRLRVWVDPEQGYNNLADTLVKAQAIVDAGMALYIDFHYSDTWADPAHQTKPLAWQDSDFDDLNAQVYTHTQTVLNSLAAANIPVAMVQLGNEISSGMLWDEGRVGSSFNGNWWRLVQLLKTAKLAVQQSDLEQLPLVMIHTDSGGDPATTEWFFSHLSSEGLEFDVIGLSFYPWWHGSLDQLNDNLSALAENYSQAIVLAEIAYPFSLVDHDAQPNFVWRETTLNAHFPATEQGQSDYLATLRNMMLNLPDNKGLGMVYWAPDWIGSENSLCQSPWDNLSLFDHAGTPLSGLIELGRAN